MTELTGVVTTGIYCVTGACSGRPKPSNIRRFLTPVAAEAAGLRACHRCRPYRREVTWVGSTFICEAVRLVLDGALHGGTESDLARELGVSSRHLRRRFQEEIGVTPTQLARSSRAHFARRLLDDTELSVTEIAFGSGFGSVRQFNRTMQEIFGEPPRTLRARRRRADRLAADGGLAIRLPATDTARFEETLSYLEEHVVEGVECVADGWYRRTIRIDGDPGVLEIGPGGQDHLRAVLHLPHWEGLIHHVRRARRVFRLDDDRDGSLTPAGAWDLFEVGVRAILHHEQVRIEPLVAAAGEAAPGLGNLGLSRVFPTPAALEDVLPSVTGSGPLLGTFSALVGTRRRQAATWGDSDLAAAVSAAGLPPWLSTAIATRA